MKKGFTLIELLAVIVILAIIALIATPIVINIIENTKESATLRSADFYLDGVEYAISKRVLDGNRVSDGTYNIIDGNICLEYTDDECTNTLIVEVKGEKPTSGSITLEEGKIKDINLIYTNKKVTFNSKGELVLGEKEDTGDQGDSGGTICTLVENGDVEPAGISAGDKYICKVKDDMETEFENGYYFFVLSTNTDGTTNLIMDRNIYYDSTNDVGKVTTSTNTGLVAWYSPSQTNEFGPVTAMDYLYNATKDWSNVPNIVMEYTDEGTKYGSIITTNNITKITKADGTTVTATYENLKARMPKISEVSNYDSTNKTNAYLYDYLDPYNSIQTTPISGIYGYWTLSSYASGSYDARYVGYYGSLNPELVDFSSYSGVRPVITLEI